MHIHRNTLHPVPHAHEHSYLDLHATLVKRSKLRFPEGSPTAEKQEDDDSSGELDDANSLQRSEANRKIPTEVNLSDVDCLPSIDTVEATHACMIR